MVDGHYQWPEPKVRDIMKSFPITTLVLTMLFFFFINAALAQISIIREDGEANLKHDGYPCGLSGGCQDDIASPDPTFIQISPKRRATITRTRFLADSHDLIGEILVPYDGALVRGNVPIFGRAYGENFKDYRVEYGQGTDPKIWTILETSDTPQTHNVIPDDLYESTDLTINGNLATWDTGLKNYVYLPSHPKDHPINFKGTYTVRLVVTSHNGETVEDRMILDVANVVPNAWGGMVRSPDGQVWLTVPEQAITAPFRLMLIQRAAQAPKTLSQERRLIGHVYEAREPNEQFTKKVVLEMTVSEEESVHGGLDRMGIYRYDMATQEWMFLPSFQRMGQRRLYTHVTQLHAFYAVMSSNIMGEGSIVLPDSPESNVHKVNVKTAQVFAHTLVNDTFENGVGQWSNRNAEHGATVSLDDLSTFDGTKALKVTNTNKGGNFAVNVRTTPFDAREFPVVEFDYRMEPEVKTSFYAKVSGRWYKIGLTDDHMELKNKRVNIADLGRVPGITTDEAWHTARFNLYDMLRTKTGNTIVEEMIMADWDVTGYMKLQFGTNPEGATYYIDNFTISRELSAGLKTKDDFILVDNFNQKKESNNLRRPVYTFQDSVGGVMRAAFNTEDASGYGHSLALSYDVSLAKTYGGYVTTLPDLDLRGFHALTFTVKSIEAGQDLLVGLRDSMGNEPKIPLSVYLPEKIDTHWKHVVIPLMAFSSTMNWGAIQNLSFSFVHDSQSKGMILIDDIQFQKHVHSLHVDSFEQWHGKNLLGGQHWTFASGAAAVNGTYTNGSPNGLYRLSYGGNIGEIKAYASDLLTYAGWTTRLGGIDCSRCASVSFRVRGGQGGEKPNIYLDDGNFRWGVNLEDYMTVSTEWQIVSIPLDDFANPGVDLTHIEEFQVVFEWEQMSSTLYLDDIWFGKKIESDS